MMPQFHFVCGPEVMLADEVKNIAVNQRIPRLCSELPPVAGLPGEAGKFGIELS